MIASSRPKTTRPSVSASQKAVAGIKDDLKTLTEVLDEADDKAAAKADAPAA